MSINGVAKAALVAARNVITGGSAASLRLLGRPRHLVGYTSEALFLLEGFLGYGGRGAEPRHIHEFFGVRDPVPVSLVDPFSGSWAPPSPSYTVDVVALSMLCRLLAPKVIFEIGTSIGHTAAHFALNSPDDTRIYTLDLPPGGRPSLTTTYVDDLHISASQRHGETIFERCAGGEKVQRLFGDSATFDFSPWHGQVDLFFIDGAHSYEYVKSDTENALCCVREGGIIAWHDFGRRGVNGVSRLISELAAEGQKIYVVPGGSLAYTRARG